MGFIYYDPVHFHSTEICSLKFRTKENLISDNSDKSGSIKTFNVRQIQSIYEIRSIETAILDIKFEYFRKNAYLCNPYVV